MLRPTCRALALGLPLLLAALPIASAAAQTDPRLVAAVRQAQEGQSDSARTTVQELLARTSATDPLYPQILYTAAILANEAADMRRRLQQVAVEFPTSAWTDDALLRLAQLDYATRQLDGATRHLERLAIDFPDSPLYAQAAYWAGMTYFDQQQQAKACRWLADGMARSRDDVEVQTQLGYLYQRCGASAQASAPAQASTVRAPAPVPGPTPTPAPTPASARGKFRVQVAAVGTPAAASAAAQKVEPLGYRMVTVQEGGLYKVRAGSFATRAEAQQAAAAIKAKLGGTPFVVSEQ